MTLGAIPLFQACTPSAVPLEFAPYCVGIFDEVREEHGRPERATIVGQIANLPRTRQIGNLLHGGVLPVFFCWVCVVPLAISQQGPSRHRVGPGEIVGRAAKIVWQHGRC